MLPQQMPASSWKETGKPGRHGRVRVSASGWVVCLLGATLLVVGVAQACEIPVYQYAIQRWSRDTYHAYYFDAGETALWVCNRQGATTSQSSAWVSVLYQPY